MGRRSVEEGRFEVPPEWPKWKKRCGVTKRGKTCTSWAVRGMPTCRFHGSGGEKNKELGELRYLAWVVLGGPQTMPVAHACRLSFAVFAERVFSNGDASAAQRMKAAMWLIERTR